MRNALNVFINCPFDEDYASLRRVLVFTIAACGFVPRCALERSDSSEIRIHKIYDLISDCQLSVHDISRVQLNKSGLPRFNMPLELGIFLGAKHLGTRFQKKKQCLIFDDEPYRYQAYISDIAGQDLKWHKRDERTLLGHVRDWLASVSRTSIPTTSYLWDRFAIFSAELRHQCQKHRHRPDELTYVDLIRHINSFIDKYSESLTVGGKKRVKDPDTWVISRAITSIRPRHANPFVILKKGASGLSFMQALLVDTNCWRIEYQDGHTDKRLQNAELLPVSDVVSIFSLYLDCDPSWRNKGTWLPSKTEPS